MLLGTRYDTSTAVATLASFIAAIITILFFLPFARYCAIPIVLLDIIYKLTEMSFCLYYNGFVLFWWMMLMLRLLRFASLPSLVRSEEIAHVFFVLLDLV